MVSNHICDHFHDNDLFEELPLEDRSHSNTETALVKVANEILAIPHQWLLISTDQTRD